ncbi:hypothetical protein ACFQX6_01815 [Streptosporangium lutulentum]
MADDRRALACWSYGRSRHSSEFRPELHLFVAARRRAGSTVVAVDSSSTLGHIVESLGVPLTESGG